MRTLYEILGVTPHATPAELKAAWRRAAMKWHPDRNRGREHGAQAEFQRINDAYAALTNPLRRAEYDLALHANVRRFAPQPHATRYHRPRRRWYGWIRFLQRNARVLPHTHTRTSAQRVPHAHWIAGIGTAIAVAVLIADLSIGDAPLRSNFVSCQPSPDGSEAPSGPATPHGMRGGGQGTRQVPATGVKPGHGTAPTVSGVPVLDDAGTIGILTATPNSNPALDEMHAALARLRALARTARDDTAPPRGTRDAGKPATAAPIIAPTTARIGPGDRTRTGKP
ncbi:hypothetical protein DFQ28_003051 [Apophysomyces sp. BC1034]|nr:hypothetical protein DFQ30_001655 [Apophysomyces sp. BC1015]KAG0189728.1 hypothetical protein DFQ28_003051 [Apophysomyces sp. BC1034]